ncbi:MAG: hypothetical protein GXP16_10050 [Gammaproteobacteria bacterium]|nr:hypothetical protein [Gammaproteobacteria bacterium]
MRQALITALQSRFQSYEDILSATEDVDLVKKIDIPKHKSLAEHLWCIVGARESYAKSITTGKWEGFNCSMANFSHSAFVGSIRSSAVAVIIAIEGVSDWSDEREDLLLALSEHEVMHEGQIIRHLYGLTKEIPDSVKWA